MKVVEAAQVTHRYGKVRALYDVTLDVPEGAVYALLGPNGAGKTTLLHILLGLRRATSGRVSLLGTEVGRLSVEQRATIGYVAEGQRLPGMMTLHELESYLAPLYATWDHALARELRRRFRLDASRRLRTYSRGERMKAALLCTLAPRPRLLLMDEPFSGMDALVKDELVRGLLELSSGEGWSVVISSHDLAELESLCDWVGFLERGRLLLSEPMDALHDRFKGVDVMFDGAAAVGAVPAEWLSLERAGQRLSFITAAYAGEAAIRDAYPHATRVAVRDVSLREVFIALARGDAAQESHPEEALV